MSAASSSRLLTKHRRRRRRFGRRRDRLRVAHRAQRVRGARGDDAGAVAGVVAAAGAAHQRHPHAARSSGASRRGCVSWPAGSPTWSSTPATTCRTRKAVPAVVQALGDLLSVPGVFVFGSNDYFGPRLKNPANYLTNPEHRMHGEPLPWQDLRAAFTERGWLDMTHTRRELEVGGPADRRGRRRRPAPVPRPLRHHRRTGQPGRQPDARADAFARAAGAGSLRRRRLPAGDGRPHPRRSALPAVLRRASSPTATWTGRGPRARRGGARTRSCTSRRASARRRSRRCGSAAGPRPRC